MLKFTKMHGLGNDFVVIDGIHQPISLTAEQIRALADRHLGIGFDQLLLVEPPVNPDADFRYRIFNADGFEVAQCGNGARCFARFVRDKKLCLKEQIRVDTDAGQLLLSHERDGQITVNMGIPRHAPAEIPLQLDKEAILYQITVEGKQWSFGAVSLGNPHAVIRVEDIAKAPVHELGPVLEKHPLFPAKANIGFMEIMDAHRIGLRVFERGVGETSACGSGACAAVVVGIEQGYLRTPVRVDLPGGPLNISWQGRGQPILMTGPAVSVFDGVIAL